ncbi:hypothetical protein AC579_3420 [Pseudocercospora musae]|uniref:Uncharacterized protein n=1 Tax=Pseudocercospora musae TaxID=113226 RepID=A0A139GT81_9PEZI|nr:hypothetical protein AC579_3420 [Pseudocercospora musae]
MPIQWSAQMDQRLLLVYVANSNLSATAAAEGWKQMHTGQNIPQPTKRAIMEHILKLKKSVGISPAKLPRAQFSTGASKRSKAGSTSQRIRSLDRTDSATGLNADQDDTELATSVKAESTGAVERREDAFAASFRVSETVIEPSDHPETAADQSDSEKSMSSGESADGALAAEPHINIKNEDDDFLMPAIDDFMSPMMPPQRTQQPRQAKSKRKMVYENDSDNDSVLWFGPRDNMSATVGRTPSPPLAASLGIGEVLAVSSHRPCNGSSTPDVLEHVSAIRTIDVTIAPSGMHKSGRGRRKD